MTDSNLPLVVKNEDRLLSATPAAIDLARELAKEGHSLEGIATALGIPRRTLFDLRKRQPELDAAVREGATVFEHVLVSALVRQALEGYAPAAMFLLKTRFGYREGEALDAEQARPSVVINLPAAMSPEDYRRLISLEQEPPRVD